MEQFRDDGGRAIPNIELCLSLSDFLQDGDVQQNSRYADPSMAISMTKIVRALENALEYREIGKRSQQEINNRIKAQKSKKRFSPLRIVSRWGGRLRNKERVNYEPMMEK